MALVAAVEVAAVGGGCIYFAIWCWAGCGGMIVPRGYRRFGDGWVRFNRISNILPIRRLHPAHVLSNNHTEDLYAIGWVCDSGFSSGSRSNITVKQVFVVLAYPVVFQGRVILRRFRFVCYIGQYFNDSSNSLGGAAAGDAVGRRVGATSYVRLSGLCGSCVSLYRCCCLFRINFRDGL
jgi:hypothetical protein